MLHIERGVTALIGGGGKTTLLHMLAEELSQTGRVVVATSTKMLVPDWCSVLIDASVADVELELQRSSIVCTGGIHKPTGKLDASSVPFSRLAAVADYVVVEADGSKGLPLKAHAPHEPVIPSCAHNVVCVVGIDGVGKPLSQACHRPERFAELANASLADAVTPGMVAAVFEAEGLHRRVYVNKVETVSDWRNAEELAQHSSTPVVAGSLWKGEFRCLR